MCQSKKLYSAYMPLQGSHCCIKKKIFFFRSQNNVIAGFTVVFREDASIRLCQSRL